jgi:4-hydroxy-3-polyprenylbenzoate decarboxylase
LPVGVDSRVKIPENLGFRNPRVVLPGILVIQGPAYRPDEHGRDAVVERFCESYTRADGINTFPLLVIVDDSEFAARTLSNFLWTTFTRSNPATDTYGIESFILDKHWGCFGSLAIDARSKPRHAPPLKEDPNVTRRVNELAAPGRPLHGII